MVATSACFTPTWPLPPPPAPRPPPAAFFPPPPRTATFFCPSTTSSPARRWLCCSAVKPPAAVGVEEGTARFCLEKLVSEFRGLRDPVERVKRFLDYAAGLPCLPESERVPENRVMGCTAQVWLAAGAGADGRMRFAADSDSEVTRGFCACLVRVLDGAAPAEVLALETADVAELNVGLPGKAHSRDNTWHNVLVTMKKKTKSIVDESEGKPHSTPSLLSSSPPTSSSPMAAMPNPRFDTL